MTFVPKEEQRLIADSFAGAFASAGDDDWSALEDLGLTLATWPEALGGAGATLSDMVSALVETGRAGSAAPVVGCALLPGLALARSGAALSALPEGPVCAVADASGMLRKSEAITGTLSLVPGAGEAVQFLLPLADGRLALLTATDVTRTDRSLLDGRGAAALEIKDAVPHEIGTVPLPDDWLRDVAATAFAADALGAMFVIRDMTLDYLKQRKQFGRALGSFQALQHQMVDIYHETEHFHSLVLLAARACDGNDDRFRLRAVSSLKRFLGTRVRPAAAAAIQLHGGIGMTEEYALGRYVKSVLVADMLMGNAAFHGNRLARHIAEDARRVTGQFKETAA